MIALDSLTWARSGDKGAQGRPSVIAPGVDDVSPASPRRVDRKNARCRGSGILNHRIGPAKGDSAGPTRDGRATLSESGDPAN